MNSLYLHLDIPVSKLHIKHPWVIFDISSTWIYSGVDSTMFYGACCLTGFKCVTITNSKCKQMYIALQHTKVFQPRRRTLQRVPSHQITFFCYLGLSLFFLKQVKQKKEAVGTMTILLPFSNSNWFIYSIFFLFLFNYFLVQWPSILLVSRQLYIYKKKKGWNKLLFFLLETIEMFY